MVLGCDEQFLERRYISKLGFYLLMEGRLTLVLQPFIYRYLLDGSADTVRSENTLRRSDYLGME